MKNALTDEEIKADLMNKLFRRHCWGARYFPVNTLVRWLGKKVKKNGKRVMRAIKQLVNEGYILLHKKGKTISLNPAKTREIFEFITRLKSRSH